MHCLKLQVDWRVSAALQGCAMYCEDVCNECAAPLPPGALPQLQDTMDTLVSCMHTLPWYRIKVQPRTDSHVL